MDGSTITCPKCQTTFPLTAAIEQPIVERLRAQFDAESAKREGQLKAKEQQLAQQTADLEKSKQSVQQQVEQKLVEERKKIVAEQELKAKEAVSVTLRDLQQQLAEKNKKIEEAQREQLALLKQKRELEEQKATFELDKAKQIEGERTKIREEAKKTALEGAATELKELQDKLNLKDKKLQEAQDAELKLRKEKAEFEEQKRAFELELARRGDEIKEVVKKEKDEEFRLKEAESNKRMEELKRQLDELKRKMEQGSQQAQGEILEVDLENSLRHCFSHDEIVPVAKGVQGADVLQRVRDEAGHQCGTIIWESKRTKAWSDGWLAKIKDDKLAAKARIAVIVSVTMPKGVPSFECREDVWISPPQLAIPLAGALRCTLIETAAAQRTMDGRHEKEELVYDYLSGPEFKGRVQAIVDSFKDMREDLDLEKRAFQKLWAKREKQIERVITNTAGLYGDVGGIIGKSLPAIAQLDLPTAGDGKDDDFPALTQQ